MASKDLVKKAVILFIVTIYLVAIFINFTVIKVILPPKKTLRYSNWGL